MGSFSSGSQTPAKSSASNTTGKPVFRIRDGALSVSVFIKERAKGDPYAFVVPERAYKDKDDKWVNTSTLYADDLLAMAELLRVAHHELKIKANISKGD